MKLYTSLLVPHRRYQQVEIDLRNLYDLHRTLSLAFPDLPKPVAGDAGAQKACDEARQEVRCLFRVDETKMGVIILVQSRIEPSWESLLQVHPGYLKSNPEIKSWEPKLSVGTPLRYRLRANPTVKRDGKRQALRTEEEQLTWLERQAESHGFSLPLQPFRSREGRTVPLPLADVVQEEVQVSQRKHLTTTHNAIRFEGVLRITDPDAFHKALAGGIGSAKGFGFGLLSIARLS